MATISAELMVPQAAIKFPMIHRRRFLSVRSSFTKLHTWAQRSLHGHIHDSRRESVARPIYIPQVFSSSCGFPTCPQRLKQSKRNVIAHTLLRHVSAVAGSMADEAN